MQEIQEMFLCNYKATPNPNTPNDNSQAEALMNHKVRLHILNVYFGNCIDFRENPINCK